MFIYDAPFQETFPTSLYIMQETKSNRLVLKEEVHVAGWMSTCFRQRTRFLWDFNAYVGLCMTSSTIQWR